MTTLIHPLTGQQRVWTPPGFTRPPRPSRSQASAPPPQVSSGSGSYFEALRSGIDRTPLSVQAYTRDWSAFMRTLSRDLLVSLARYLYDNNGTVSYAVDTIANYTTPLIPQPTSPNPEWNKAALLYWDDWCKRADFTGRFHFDVIQRLVSKALDTDGDVGWLMTTENGFAQVQLLESWRIRTPRMTMPPANTLFGDGVAFDTKGRVLGFFLDTEAPMLPVNQMRICYDPDRVVSYRGISPIRRGANDIRDMSDIKGFEKLATKVGSALSAVIEQDGPIAANVWGDDTTNDPGAEASAFEKKLSIAELLGGDIPTIPSGSKLHQITNDRPGGRVTEFLHFLAASFVLGLGLPPSFLLDSNTTSSSNRGVNGKAQRKLTSRQDLVQGPFLERVWLLAMADAINRGELEPQVGFDRISWMGPAKISIDEGRDAAQWREDVASGLMSRRDRYAINGQDNTVEIDQIFAEDERIIDKAIELAERKGKTIPGLAQMILAKHGFGKPSAPAAPQAAKQQDAAGAKDEEDPKQPEKPDDNSK